MTSKNRLLFKSGSFREIISKREEVTNKKKSEAKNISETRRPGSTMLFLADLFCNIINYSKPGPRHAGSNLDMTNDEMKRAAECPKS
jgi:hypothetical protein